MEPSDFIEHQDQNGRLHFSAIIRWQHARGPAHCLMQAVFLPGGQLKIFLAQLMTCPRGRGIFYDPESATNAAWHALEEHFGYRSARRHPEETAFLTSISEDPDEDTHRLVFADWLEENDQPDKAAFVRFEVEMSRLPKNVNNCAGVLVDHSRLDGPWRMALIRLARNVEWLFRYGEFSTYDIGEPSGTARYVLAPDSQRKWQRREQYAVSLTAEEVAQIIGKTNVQDVEAALKKLPKMPHLDPRDY